MEYTNASIISEFEICNRHILSQGPEFFLGTKQMLSVEKQHKIVVESMRSGLRLPGYTPH